MTYKNTILTQQLEASKKRIEDYKTSFQPVEKFYEEAQNWIDFYCLIKQTNQKAAREFESDLLPTSETIEEPERSNYFILKKLTNIFQWKGKANEKPAKLIRQHLQEIKKTIIELESWKENSTEFIVSQGEKIDIITPSLFENKLTFYDICYENLQDFIVWYCQKFKLNDINGYDGATVLLNLLEDEFNQTKIHRKLQKKLANFYDDLLAESQKRENKIKERGWNASQSAKSRQLKELKELKELKNKVNAKIGTRADEIVRERGLDREYQKLLYAEVYREREREREQNQTSQARKINKKRKIWEQLWAQLVIKFQTQQNFCIGYSSFFLTLKKSLEKLVGNIKMQQKI
jgi:hypothetical protein